MSYFSQSKGAAKPAERIERRVESEIGAQPADVESVFGPGMMITGTIVCAGALQVFGRVSGEIHAARLTICDGARVEGKIVAQDTVIRGAFKGTLHGNSVHLQGTATVEGEIYNRSLAIEQNAHFEGVARRLDRPVDPPAVDRGDGEAAAAPPLLLTLDAVA